jgi:hypothetical protein
VILFTALSIRRPDYGVIVGVDASTDKSKAHGRQSYPDRTCFACSVQHLIDGRPTAKEQIDKSSVLMESLE